MTLVGLVSCSVDKKPPVVGETGDSGSEAFSPGAITQPAADASGELNARSAKHGRLFAGKDGSCYVRVTPPEPLPPGATGPTQSLPCPKSMKAPAFVTCGFGVVSRKDKVCTCSPWGGNPPPPSFEVPCPVHAETTKVGPAASAPAPDTKK